MSGQGRARRLRDRLGERDLAILESLQELRLMSGAQLRRLHFPDGQQTTQARKTRAVLKRLAELRLIVRSSRRVGGIRAGSEGHVIGLSGLGQAVLTLGTGTPRRHRRVTDTKPAFQAHALAVSELAVALYEHQRAGDCAIDKLRAEPGCWRWFTGLGGQRRVLKPDLFVRLDVGEFEQSAFIELDQATESLPTIARKLGVYVDYWRSGQEQHEHGVFPKVWWVVPDAARLKAITRAVQRAPGEARDLFAVVLGHDAAEALTQPPGVGGSR